MNRVPDTTPAQRRGMRLAILAQCFGCLGMLAFNNNLVLLFLSASGFRRAWVVGLLALPMVADTLARIPAAYASDRFGKKRVGLIGMCVGVAGFSSLILSGWAEQPYARMLVVMGVIAAGAGSSIMSSSWFALLSPIVPEHLRGRFFGRLRFAWQSVGIVFAGVCAWVLSEDASVAKYQVILLAVAAALVVRIVVYLRIPELEPPTGGTPPFKAALAQTLRGPNYMSFCAYVFLLTLFTGSCPTFFGMVEKQVLELGDGQVAWMGNLMMIGSVTGFALGGRAVDRLGTKPVFMSCHFAYSAVLLLFLCRGAVPGPVVYVVGALRFCFGLVAAASSIAISTELLALIPAENKSLAASVCSGLQRAGAAMAGVLAAWFLELGILSESWRLWGMPLSSYDALLLGCGIMVALLVVTLGLVPSVIGKPRWLP